MCLRLINVSQVDENEVEVLHIVSSPDGFGLNAVDSYRYPKAGRLAVN